jgi:saccharopine dehydrogenase (NAD+, L-glutamate forming)
MPTAIRWLPENLRADNVPTLLRGTLRQEGFCKAWNVFVQLGLTDDSFPVEDSEHLTYAGLVHSFLPPHMLANPG